jgi:hypothetical protein
VVMANIGVKVSLYLFEKRIKKQWRQNQ